MSNKKCIISKGYINKYIFFALIAGLSKCIVSTMLYIFKDYANYNKHPLIIGFNAGIGMSFAFVPLIILKIQSHRANKNLNKFEIMMNFSIRGGKICEYEYLMKFDKTKLKIQKYLILLACAFLDFGQKFLTFLLNKYIINNIWMFNICFISLFEFWILKTKLNKHQYLSSFVIVLLGIAATVVGLYNEEGDIFFKLILCIFIEIMYSLAIVLSKFLMDNRSCSPYEVTFYEGIFALIVNSILLAVFTNIPLPDDEKYDKIFKITTYNGKKYLDNFYAAFNDMGIGEIFLFILSAIGRLISNLFGHIVVKHYTSSHIILVLILGEMALAFKESQEWDNITQFILFCFALFMLLIFTEIIEINVCDLEKNTKKNIQERERGENRLTLRSLGDDARVEVDDNIEIEMNHSETSSPTQTSFSIDC